MTQQTSLWEMNMHGPPRWGCQTRAHAGGPPISRSCHFLPRIPMSWTFLRETFWWSSWKERMAGGLWNGMDNVALSLGPTWRSSEEKERLVPTHLGPDGGQACSHHCPGFVGQSQTRLPWGWVLATPSAFLPEGIEGIKEHILPLLGSFSLTHVSRGSIQKPEYGEPGEESSATYRQALSRQSPARGGETLSGQSPARDRCLKLPGLQPGNAGGRGWRMAQASCGREVGHSRTSKRQQR